jgi:hypothetical protein
MLPRLSISMLWMYWSLDGSMGSFHSQLGKGCSTGAPSIVTGKPQGVRNMHSQDFIQPSSKRTHQFC